MTLGVIEGFFLKVKKDEKPINFFFLLQSEKKFPGEVNVGRNKIYRASFFSGLALWELSNKKEPHPSPPYPQCKRGLSFDTVRVQASN